MSKLNTGLSYTLLFVASFVALSVTLQGTIASEIASVSYSGQCGDFIVTVSAEGLYDGQDECWDAKVDAPGRVFDGSSGESGEWRSTFYYVDDAFCPPEQEASFSVKPGSIAPIIEGRVKLRQDSKVIESDLIIEQDCPQPLGWEWVLIGSIAFIVFFGYLLVWWMRRK